DQAKKQLDSGLEELEERGLLQWDRSGNRYDLHPVVRAVALEDFGSEERKAAFKRVGDHFQRLPPTPLEQVRDIRDIQRELEIFRALLGAEQLEMAAQFYVTNLADVLRLNLCA